MRLFLCSILLWSVAAFAKDKTPYHDGTLLSFHSVNSGERCAIGDTTARCRNTLQVIYLLSIEGHTYSVSPDIGMFSHANVLKSVNIGEKVQVREESGGPMYIRVGNSESKYKVIGAE